MDNRPVPDETKRAEPRMPRRHLNNPRGSERDLAEDDRAVGGGWGAGLNEKGRRLPVEVVLPV
jgi:hypothetical protein